MSAPDLNDREIDELVLQAAMEKPQVGDALWEEYGSLCMEVYQERIEHFRGIVRQLLEPFPPYREEGLKKDDAAWEMVYDDLKAEAKKRQHYLDYRWVMELCDSNVLALSDFFTKKEAMKQGNNLGQWRRHRPNKGPAPDISHITEECVYANWLNFTKKGFRVGAKVQRKNNNQQMEIRVISGLNERCHLIFDDGSTGFPQDFICLKEGI